MYKRITIIFSLLTVAVIIYFSGNYLNPKKNTIPTIHVSINKTTSDYILISWLPIKNAQHYEISIYNKDKLLYKHVSKKIEKSLSFAKLYASTSYNITIKAINKKTIARGNIRCSTKSLPMGIIGKWLKGKEEWTFRANGTGIYTYNTPIKFRWKVKKTNRNYKSMELLITKLFKNGIEEKLKFSYQSQNTNRSISFNMTTWLKQNQKQDSIINNPKQPLLSTLE